MTPSYSIEELKPCEPILPESKHQMQTTMTLLVVVATLDGADFQLLPASFRALESDLGFGLRDLSLLAVGQGVAQGISGPFWGNLADNGVSRRYLIFYGMLSWAILTALLASITHFQTILILRILNGCALGLLTPLAQSLVADLSQKAERGYNFGWIEFGNRTLGQVIGIIFVTSVSEKRIWGMAGWRFAYCTIAFFSLLLAPVVLTLLSDPPRRYKPESIGLMNEVKCFCGYLTIPTFRAIALQGIFGTIPAAALAFGTMYLQYCGLPDATAAICFAMYPVGSGFGCLLGGSIGDRMAIWSPQHGRALTAEASVSLGMPIIVLIFLAVPRTPLAPIFGALFLTLGLVASWCPTGCNKPVFLDVVPGDHQASVMSWEKAIETTSGQLMGPSIVSNLALMVFGYQSAAESVSYMSAEQRMNNASSLGKALVAATLVPWAICLMCYVRLHWTYQIDVDAAEALPLVPS